MKRTRLMLTALFAALLLLVPYWCFGNEASFALRIVDERGRGVDAVRVTDDTGTVHYSNPVGLVWLKRSRATRTVHLFVYRAGYQTPGDTTVQVTGDGQMKLTIRELTGTPR